MTAPEPERPLAHAIRQLAQHLASRKPLSPPAWLSPAEAGLFARMATADQVEGLRVVAELRAWGLGADRDLLLAGLLHDAGKSLAPSAAARYRVLSTVLEALAPRLLPAVARRNRTMEVLLNHPRLGAEMAAQAGLTADAQRLIARHHRPPADARMQALQRADGLH